jgi:hypothetical protein
MSGIPNLFASNSLQIVDVRLTNCLFYVDGSGQRNPWGKKRDGKKVQIMTAA